MASPPSKVVRRAVIGLASTAFAVVAVLAPGLPAQAKPSLSEINSQITTLNNKIEDLVEQYNKANTKLGKDVKAQKTLEKQIAPSQLEATNAQAQIGGLAASIYMSGPHQTMVTMLSATNTSNLLDSVSTLNAVAHSRGISIANANAKLTQYQAQEKPLNDLVAKEKVQVADLASKKKQIESQLSTLKKLQQEVAGTGGSGDSSGNVGSGPYTKSQLMPVSCPDASGSGKGYEAAVKACSLVWRPGVSRYGDSAGKGWIMYHYAAASESNGYDCSGLTMTAWAAAGKSLAHYTGDQWDESTAITKSELKPGDLVFYNSGNHVAIYVGGGWIVQAEHTGAPIMMSHVGFESVVGYRRVKT